MEIPFEGQLTRRQLTAIFALALKSIYWMTWVFEPLFLISTGMLIYTLVKTGEGSMPLVFATAFTGFMGSYPFWTPVVSAKNAFKLQPEMSGTFSGLIRDDAVLLRTMNANQEFKWSLYKKLVRNAETVLLYQNARCFNFFPRSFFASDADWQAFQSLLDAKIQRGELLDRTGKQAFGLETGLPRWLIILLIVLIILPAICGFLALLLQPILRGY